MGKWGCAQICAYLSLAISITIVALWCCDAGGFTVVSLDSFVGVIVALLAIIVTFVVGWQIYNVIEMKEKMEKLDILEDKLSKQEETTKQQYYKSKEYINILIAYDANKTNDHKTAFRFFLDALNNAIQQNNPSSNVETVLKSIESSANQLASGSIMKSRTLHIIHETDKEIRSSVNYPFIKERYEKIYNIFESKVKEEKKNE